MIPEPCPILLPRYQCHREVRAVKIREVRRNPLDATLTLIPDDPRIDPFPVRSGFASLHNPKAGGYFMVYEDGNQDYSAPEAFEAAYTLL